MSQHNVQKEVNHRLRPLVHPLTEVVGNVDEVREDAIILSFAKQRYLIPLRSIDELTTWRSRLKVGKRVGILVLDDGTKRIRILE